MNFITEILLAVAILLFFTFLISKTKIFARLGLKKWVLYSLFAVKLVAAAGIYGVYSFYYTESKTSDMYKYHEGGKIMYSALKENPSDYLKMLTGICAQEPQLEKYYDKMDHWYKSWNYGLFNDNRTIIRYNALLCLISQGSLIINILINAFVAFLGSFFLASAILNITQKNKFMIIISAFVIPSVLFWSSGLLKESLVMFSVGLLIYSWFQISKQFKLKYLIVAILAATLLFLAKFYVLMAMIPGLIFFPIFHNAGKLKQSLSLMVIFAVIVTLFFTSGTLFNINLREIVVNKQKDFINMVNENKGSSDIEISKLDTSISSYALNLPQAYINVFFRPFPNEVNTIFKLLAFAENLFFFTLFLLMCFRFKKPNNEEFKLILFSISFMLIFYGLIGLTTPNLGAMVRYKIPAMPFILVCISICCDLEKIENKLKNLYI